MTANRAARKLLLGVPLGPLNRSHCTAPEQLCNTKLYEFLARSTQCWKASGAPERATVAQTRSLRASGASWRAISRQLGLVSALSARRFSSVQKTSHRRGRQVAEKTRQQTPDCGTREASRNRASSASRAPPWLLSGWGCRGRREMVWSKRSRAILNSFSPASANAGGSFQKQASL